VALQAGLLSLCIPSVIDHGSLERNGRCYNGGDIPAHRRDAAIPLEICQFAGGPKMNVYLIPLSLKIANPPQYAGTYAAENSWVWYAPGAKKDVWPHFSILREGLEFDPKTDE
jgi:hypothetical protein